ncbi:MAG: ABC transporter permease [Acidimicrobiia bacterium]
MTAAVAVRRDRTIEWRRVLAPLGGLTVLFVAWTVASQTMFRSKHAIPTPWAVFAKMADDLAFYRPHVRQTLGEAGWGYLWGNLAAFGVGAVFVVAPIIERLTLRLVVAVYCLPLIATAPILQIIFAGDRAKIAVASQSVFFTTLVGVTLGLRSADPALLAVVRAHGGGSLHQLLRVRLRAAIPGVFSGLKIAAPAAVLGAVIGEFLGGRRGIGVAMIASQQSFNVTRTWGLGIVLTVLSATVYVLTGWLGKRLAPWEATSTSLTEMLGSAGGRGPLPIRIAVSLAYLVASIVIVLLAWSWALRIFNLNNFFAKTPGDVWTFLTGPSGASNRTVLIKDLRFTLTNAALGYLAGTAGALLLAVVVAGNRVVEQAVMPVAIALRSVPLVAMTPLVALIFGRGLACVLVIAGIVTFFPSLVQLVDGLRSAPKPAYDVVSAFGGDSRQQLLRVRLPYALPSLFASARVAAPLAIVGATLAEWLATGKGIGNHMVLALSRSRYTDLWASVAVLTACAVTIYGIAAALEGVVLRRFAGANRT